ncbi:MAG: diacylglycerol kinase family lipid kinase [Acidobacteriota bacterium]|nr:diacylglycerol kinase family lipid kinase [Acidobacteriota bacterium]
MAHEFSSGTVRTSSQAFPHGASPFLVLGNKKAGRGRAFRIGGRLETWLASRGCPARFFWPNSREELRGLVAKAAAAGERRIVVLGGDGTLLDVVSQVRGLDIELGLLPAGDANDVAAALNLPRDPLSAADFLLKWNTRLIDLVRVRMADGRERVYVGVGGAGLDAEAARLAAGQFRWLPGIWRYLAGAVVAFGRGERFEVQLEFDGQSWRGDVLLVAVANAPAYGGGIRIAPEARVDDGCLDIALAEDLSWKQILRALPSLGRAGDTRRLNLRRFRARHVRIHTAFPVAFHGDGEALGATPLEVEVLPGALRVVAP